MKYDWISLKRKFITKRQGNKNYTLKQFAEDEKINYKTLRERASGWIEERETKHRQATDRIIEKTLERQIENEVDMNLRHYELAGKLLSIMEKTLDFSSLSKSPKSINTLAKALKTTQDIQRTASGIDKDKAGGDGGIIQEFIKAVKDENSDKPI